MAAKRTKPHTLTAEALRALLRYDADTGKFIRIAKPSAYSATVIGAEAGTQRKDGYRMITLGGVTYMAHRLAFLYMTGDWPTQQVDHVNGVKNDNRWGNLRDVPASVNKQNMRAPKRTNTTGVLGVTHSKRGRYQATIAINGRNKNLGIFDDTDQAHAAYLMAKRKLHEGCTI